MQRSDRNKIKDFLIVGAGFSGLGAAIEIKRRGYSFAILEKAAGVGGTWYENTYPNCACDVPSHLYSYSFEPNPHWSHIFAPQSEILAYLERCVDRHELHPYLQLNTEVLRAEYDEQEACWCIFTRDGEVHRGRYLAFGAGPLSRPAYPDTPGLERFTGKTFHSAAWDHSYDLSGKRVAVIGTGASAIQFVPHVTAQAAQTFLFQRTAPWVLPRPDRSISEVEQRVFATLPIIQRSVRNSIYGWLELRALGFTRYPKILQIAEWLGKKNIERQIKDPTLRKKVTPNFRAGCKRILMSNDYYSALERPGVELLSGLSEIRERSVVSSDGVEREVDAIIYGTGFRVTDLLTPLQILGRDGVDLNDTWARGMEAYLGTQIAGFPNFFMLLGPNTGLGHNSMVFMIEAQVHYMLQCVQAAEERGARAVEIKPQIQQSFNISLQRRLERTIWASGCKSWYLDTEGKNRTLWPGFTAEYWLKTRKIEPLAHTFSHLTEANVTVTSEPIVAS